MLRGLYTAASGMITQQRQQESLSNNIANANTPGYKADQTTIRAFPELLLQQTGSSSQIPTSQGGMNFPISQTIGPINTGVYVQETVPNFAQGNVQETGLSTDVAIIQGQVPDENGFLFFSVQNENGEERLTRNGNFTVDGEGFLVTNQGNYVLDEAGNPIQTNGLDYVVTPEGFVQTADGTFPLGIRYVEDSNQLVKEGNDLFAGESIDVPAAATFSLQQGALEQSNVNTMQTMTDMMNAYRLFETNQRVLRAYDESLGKTVNEIGRLG